MWHEMCQLGIVAYHVRALFCAHWHERARTTLIPRAKNCNLRRVTVALTLLSLQYGDCTNSSRLCKLMLVVFTVQLVKIVSLTQSLT